MAIGPVSELLSISQLSADDVIELLSRGDLRFERGPENQLLIDLDSIDPAKIGRLPVNGKKDQLDPALVQEVLAAEAGRALVEIFNESLEMAIKWGLRKQTD